MKAVFRHVGADRQGRDQPTDEHGQEARRSSAGTTRGPPRTAAAASTTTSSRPTTATSGNVEQVSVEWAKKYQDCLNHPEIQADRGQGPKVSCQLSGRGAIELYLFGDPRGGVPGA